MKKHLFLILILLIPIVSTAQIKLSGNVTLTSKGVSLIPSLTLDKPAIMTDLSIGKGKFSFDPSLRFSVEGKPWSFIFWFRYKPLNTGKLRLTVGAHPAFSFKEVTATFSGTERTFMSVRRIIAGEIYPNYYFTKNISAGIYYLYSHGFDYGITKNTHFLSLRSRIADILPLGDVSFSLNPQLYYLRMDSGEGSYFSNTLTASKINCPVSISFLTNTPIKTNILAGNSFLWNLSLQYSF